MLERWSQPRRKADDVELASTASRLARPVAQHVPHRSTTRRRTCSALTRFSEPARPVAGRRQRPHPRDRPPGRRVRPTRAPARSRRTSRASAPNEEEYQRTARRCTASTTRHSGDGQRDARPDRAALHRGGAKACRQMAAEMQQRARRHPHRAAQGHPRAAAGDRRQRRPDAPRDRRPDRGAGRAQPHRRPPRPRPRRGRAGRAAAGAG